MEQNDVLYFLHIPKTAGTTFTSVLDSFFDYQSIFPEQVYRKLILDLPEDFTKYKLIRGHFGHTIYKIIPQNILYLTMLRDPIQRTISYYDHMKLAPTTNNWVHENFLSEIETSDSALQDPKKIPVFTNYQIRHLAVDLDIRSIAQYYKMNKRAFFFDTVEEFIHPDISDELLLQTAKQRLLEFSFFGLVERFEESLFLLYYTFGWKPIRSIWNLMVAPRKTSMHDISEHTMKIIKEYTKLDYELYEYAKELFEQRLFQMMDDLKERYYKPNLDKLSFREMMYVLLEKHYEEHFDYHYENSTSSINFDFSQKMFGTGWFRREINDAAKKFYRWTGPTTISTIDLPLSPESDLRIQLRIIGQASIEIRDSLRLLINGVSMESLFLVQNIHNPIYPDITPLIIETIVSKESLKNDKKFTQLTLMIKDTLNLRSLNPGYENREVGIALDKITIIPIVSAEYEKNVKGRISRYYTEYLRRKPDFEGLEYYFAQIMNGIIKLEDMPQILQDSSEFRNIR
ncbi:sulfotransferase family 2 domain-containing protein [Nitrosotalea sinensis]|uniref:sulfotransferase family 2 domain-containing protein n=1 Tax=Nitrosotalea sinensis TaxID=1499975 RepID=UPI001FE89FF8|nr:sulfotransferase family 2 domain-containing protein [Candidatus Nitrosotalea sinensis]